MNSTIKKKNLKPCKGPNTEKNQMLDFLLKKIKFPLRLEQIEFHERLNITKNKDYETDIYISRHVRFNNWHIMKPGNDSLWTTFNNINQQTCIKITGDIWLKLKVY